MGTLLGKVYPTTSDRGVGEGWKEKREGRSPFPLFVLAYNLIHNLHYLAGYVMVLAGDVINQIA